MYKKESQSMPTTPAAPTAPSAPSAPVAQLTGTKASETAKKVNDMANQLKDQVSQLEKAQQAAQQAVQQAQQAAQQAPAAPSALADDQNADDIMKDIKMTIGKLYDMFSDSEQDHGQDDSVAVVLGPKQMSIRESTTDATRREEKTKNEKKGIEDMLPGGEADNVPEDKVNKKQLDMGQKVEMEHTDDPDIAREIARDHLSEELKDGKEKEDQEYYTNLKKIHEDKCSDVVPGFWRQNLDYGDS